MFYEGDVVRIEEATRKIQSLAKIDLMSMKPFISPKLAQDLEEIQVGVGCVGLVGLVVLG